MDITKLDYGVELIHGLMGSGKSFFAVRRALETVEQTRRPVYTNLPMKWKVVRAYLRNRGGSELANLFRRLDEQHWRRFLTRQHQWAKFRERLAKRSPADLDATEFSQLHSALLTANGPTDPDRLRSQAKFYPSQIAEWFVSNHGPHIVDGPDANWIPPGSIICIDEAQHWHPMSKQAEDPNRPDLLAYITMCRHHVHWLWIITQDPANIAIEFRRHFHYAWRVWNRGEDRLAWGIRWKHLGLRAMGYVRATPDQLESMERRPGSDNARPTESFTILPWLPRNGVFFRLYSSHTNVGSARHLARELERSRRLAGLTADGSVIRTFKQDDTMPTVPLTRRLIGATRTSALLTLAAGIAFGAGRIVGGSTIEPEQQPPDTVATEPEYPTTPLAWPKWQAAGSRPWIDSRRASAGDDLTPEVRLDFIGDSGRSLVLRARGDWWLWRWGETQPLRVGRVEDVRTAVAELLSGATDASAVP